MLLDSFWAKAGGILAEIKQLRKSQGKTLFKYAPRINFESVNHLSMPGPSLLYRAPTGSCRTTNKELLHSYRPCLVQEHGFAFLGGFLEIASR